jgi:cytidylate kinase
VETAASGATQVATTAFANLRYNGLAMGTITISRQLGSLGSEVARQAANRLGYRAVWRDELVNQAARRAGTPEVALAAIDELRLLGICPSTKACAAYCQAMQQVMDELATAGNVVIVGRAGQVTLRGRPGVLHVRVIAPAQVRAERVASRRGIPFAAAQAQVEASDRYRYNYLRRFHHVRWDDPDLYDLIVNTERVTSEAAAALIAEALLRQFQAAQDAQPEPE